MTPMQSSKNGTEFEMSHEDSSRLLVRNIQHSRPRRQLVLAVLGDNLRWAALQITWKRRRSAAMT